MIKIFILFSVLNSIAANSQPIRFEKIYGSPYREEIGVTVIQTQDNGYIIGASGYNCMRTNQYGDTLWTGKIRSPANCIQKTFDNNFVISTPNYPVVKIDINGNIFWERNRYNVFATTYYIMETSDKGFILSGTILNDSDRKYPYVLKTDSSGLLLWQKIFYDYPERDIAQIIQTYDQGYVFTGHDYMVKLDSVGNVIWDKYYNGIVQATVSIIQLKTGYLLGGGDDLVKVDTAGNFIWKKIYSLGVFRQTIFYRISKTNDGGYAITGERDTTGGPEYVPLILLLKTDSLGNQKWFKLYGNNLDYNSGLDLKQTSDSGYIITGLTFNNLNNNRALEDLILIKTDKIGNGPSVSIYNNSNELVKKYVLYQNFPNPFNPTTTIRYDLQKSFWIKLSIFNILGIELKVLINQRQDPGTYEIEFDGDHFPSGIYLFQLDIKDLDNMSKIFNESQKMFLIK